MGWGPSYFCSSSVFFNSSGRAGAEKWRPRVSCSLYLFIYYCSPVPHLVTTTCWVTPKATTVLHPTPSFQQELMKRLIPEDAKSASLPPLKASPGLWGWLLGNEWAESLCSLSYFRSSKEKAVECHQTTLFLVLGIRWCLSLFILCSL